MVSNVVSHSGAKSSENNCPRFGLIARNEGTLLTARNEKRERGERERERERE